MTDRYVWLVKLEHSYEGYDILAVFNYEKSAFEDVKPTNKGSRLLAIYDNEKSAFEYVESIIDNKYIKPKITDGLEYYQWDGGDTVYMCTRHLLKT